MFSILQNIWNALAGVGHFFAAVASALKQAFLFLASIWLAASHQIHAMPVWLQALCVTAVVVGVVLIILLSR